MKSNQIESFICSADRSKQLQTLKNLWAGQQGSQQEHWQLPLILSQAYT